MSEHLPAPKQGFESDIPKTITDLTHNLDQTVKAISTYSLEQLEELQSNHNVGESLGLGYNREALCNYIDRLNQADTAIRQREQELAGEDALPHNRIGLDELGMVPGKQLHSIYFSDRGTSLRKLLTRSNHPPDIQASLSILKGIHGYPYSTLGFLDAGNRRQDPTLQDIFEKTGLPQALIDSEYQTVGESDTASPAENAKEIRNWGRQYLETLTELPKEQIDDMLFHSHTRTNNPFTGLVDKEVYGYLMEEVASIARFLGTETAHKLYEHAGIVDLDYASLKQLQLMTKLIDKDPAAISHLQAGDVTVLFVDGKGDHNGAISSTSIVYATANNRTLFFEINKPTDFFRHFSFLKKCGIQPSTIVLGNHGNVGAAGFGEGKDSFTIVNREPFALQPANTFSYASMQSLPRIVNEYMQDSRGIDDNEEAKGRRRIILDSCAQAKPVTITKYVANPNDPSGPRIPQISFESPAATITHVANNPSLDVYAGAGYLETYETEHGMRFTHTVNNQIEPLPIQRHALDKNGNLIIEESEELLLRAKEPAKDHNHA